MKRIKSSQRLHDLEKYDQQRTRKSILKVFQSHFKPAEKSSSNSRQKYSNSPILSKRCRQTDPDSSMSDSDSPKQFSVKTKKRRRRAERNKSRSVSTSKDSSTKKIDVQQHLKSAHNIIMREMEIQPIRQTERNFCAVTNSRITTKLGLFKKGKKSGTIARGPIMIPASIKEKTDEDIKKILKNSASESDSHDNDPLYSIAEKENSTFSDFPSHDQDHSLPVMSDSERHSFIVSPGSIKKAAHSISSLSCSPSPIVPIAGDFPESPPLETIAKILLSDLKPSRWFPGSGYLQDLQEELNKLMKHNCSTNQNRTPMKAITPRSVKSDTVKRSLLKSLLSAGQTPVSAPVQYVGKACIMEMETDSPGVQRVDIQPQPMQTDTTHITDVEDINKYSDARSLLSHNDSIIASRSKSMPESDGCGQPGALPGHNSMLPQRPTRVTSDMLMSICQDIDNSSQSAGYHYQSQPSALLHTVPRQYHSTTVSNMEGQVWGAAAPKQAVITKMVEHPEYMPRFHGDYYKDHLERRTEWDHHQLQDSARDILDMVDQSRTTGWSGERTSVSSDFSPLHLPPNHILPLKPSLATPSPPDNLYPRRLY